MKKFTSKKPADVVENVFCKLVLKPIRTLVKAALDNNKKKIKKLVSSYNISLTDKEKELEGRQMAKALMRNWIPASDCMMRLIINKLPSPIEAQKYRAPHLYNGLESDPACQAMINCDPNGPVMMYVSKMVPEKEGSSRFLAFGRVFSGTIRAGAKLKVMGPNYVHGETTDLHFEAPRNVVTLMGAKVDPMPDIPCGNICALEGMKTLIKTGTVSSDPDANSLKDMKFAVAPVVQRSVSVQDPKMLAKLVEGLDRLRRSDPACRVYRDSATGENIIAGTGELHLEILMNDLSNFMGGAKLVENDPIVTYRETVIGRTPEPQLAKSKNKHNRLFVTVEPMADGLRTDIENEKVVSRPKDPVAQNRHIVTSYGMDRNDVDSRRMYGFGPTDKDPNMYINTSTGVQYLDTVKDSICQGFREATLTGPICGEQVSGAIFRLHDAKFHSDSVHRGIGEVGPASRRSCWAALLNSQPRLMEPIYLCGITVPTTVSGAIYSLMAQRRGTVIDNVPMAGTPMTMVKAYLPVRESFGFDSELREKTSGQAFAQCTFSHYQVIDSDPFEEGSLANKIAMEIRTRKRMGSLPALDNYSDRL